MRSPFIANLLIVGVVLLSLSCAERPTSFSGLPFIHDDYDAAIAEARQKGVPIFVDATAAWCHSCLSRQLREHEVVDAQPVPPGQARYFLVRPTSPAVGSWGQDSAGQPRAVPCAPS